MTNDLGRDVSDEERRLWRRVKQEYFENNLDPHRDTINAVYLGNQLGIHEERSRQFVRTWSNDGLVTTVSDGANYLTLTDAGVRHSFED